MTDTLRQAQCDTISLLKRHTHRHLPPYFMRKLFIAIIIALVFGGGWGLLYYILG